MVPEVRRQEEAVRLVRRMTVYACLAYEDGETNDPLAMEKLITAGMESDGWTTRVESITRTADGSWMAVVRQEKEVPWNGRR